MDEPTGVEYVQQLTDILSRVNTAIAKLYGPLPLPDAMEKVPTLKPLADKVRSAYINTVPALREAADLVYAELDRAVRRSYSEAVGTAKPAKATKS